MSVEASSNRQIARIDWTIGSQRKDVRTAPHTCWMQTRYSSIQFGKMEC